LVAYWWRCRTCSGRSHRRSHITLRHFLGQASSTPASGQRRCLSLVISSRSFRAISPSEATTAAHRNRTRHSPGEGVADGEHMCGGRSPSASPGAGPHFVLENAAAHAPGAGKEWAAGKRPADKTHGCAAPVPSRSNVLLTGSVSNGMTAGGQAVSRMKNRLYRAWRLYISFCQVVNRSVFGSVLWHGVVAPAVDCVGGTASAMPHRSAGDRPVVHCSILLGRRTPAATPSSVWRFGSSATVSQRHQSASWLEETSPASVRGGGLLAADRDRGRGCAALRFA